MAGLGARDWGRDNPRPESHMDSLFRDEAAPPDVAATAPLAERMRPRTFDEFVGQEELLAPGKPLREAIERDLLQSIILWGRRARQNHAGADHRRHDEGAFVSFSAVLAGIKEIRDVMAEAERLRPRPDAGPSSSSTKSTGSTRRSRTPSSPRVEAGDIVLVGATTENPSFEVNAALPHDPRCSCFAG